MSDQTVTPGEAAAFAGQTPRRPLLTIERALLVAALVPYLGLLAAASWAFLTMVPDQLAFTLAGHAFHVHGVHERLFGDAALMFLILPGALWVEFMALGWAKSSLRRLLFARSASEKTDLAVFILGQGHVLDVLGRLMVLGASLISGAWIRAWLASTFGFEITLPAMPVAVAVVVYFFVYTFFDYWTHRLDHTPFLWPLHRYHHSAEEFCVITAARVHPAAFTPIFIINIPMAVLGAPQDVMIYVNVAVITIGFLIHSRLESDWGWFGRWVIQSPVGHRLHHKLDMSYPTGNFSIAPIWDRLFGTYDGKCDPHLAIGVERDYRHGFWFVPDLLRDYWHFWRGVFTLKPLE